MNVLYTVTSPYDHLFSEIRLSKSVQNDSMNEPHGQDHFSIKIGFWLYSLEGKRKAGVLTVNG